METQTMITLGDTPRDRAGGARPRDGAPLVRRVTPVDWRDVWMKRGMATFPWQGTWMAEHRVPARRQALHAVGGYDTQLCSTAGLPSSFDPSAPATSTTSPR